MKNIMKYLEDIYAAVAFAEEGEHDTAKEIMSKHKLEKLIKVGKKKQNKRLKFLEDIYAAVAFAEEGEHGVAREILTEYLPVKICEGLPLDKTIFEEKGRCIKPTKYCEYCKDISEIMKLCYKKTFTGLGDELLAT